MWSHYARSGFSSNTSLDMHKWKSHVKTHDASSIQRTANRSTSSSLHTFAPAHTAELDGYVFSCWIPTSNKSLAKFQQAKSLPLSAPFHKLILRKFLSKVFQNILLEQVALNVLLSLANHLLSSSYQIQHTLILYPSSSPRESQIDNFFHKQSNG